VLLLIVRVAADHLGACINFLTSANRLHLHLLLSFAMEFLSHGCDRAIALPQMLG